MTSSQKFIARNRAPRVQIAYDVEVYGAEKKVQLPFVMGVMADLAGNPVDPLPAVADRKFLEIDVDTFDSRMMAMRPRAAFAVPNTLTGQGSLAVDLTFEAMDDFAPAAIARKVEPLRALLQARTDLADLKTYMDGKAGAEGLIERVLADAGLLAALATAPTDSGTEAALNTLRASAPPSDHTSPDAVADAFAALRMAAPAEAARDDMSDALAALRRAAPVDQIASDDTADALAALRATAKVEEARDDSTDALAALRRAAPLAQVQSDDTADVLGALRAAAPVEETPDQPSIALAALLDARRDQTAPDAITDALAALRVAGQTGSVQADRTAEALNAQRASSAPEPAVDNRLEMLAALRIAAPTREPGVTDQTDAFAALRATTPVAEVVPNAALDALAALRTVAVDTPMPSVNAADALASLRAGAPVADQPAAGVDALAALRSTAVETPTPPDTSADAFASLRAGALPPDQPDAMSHALSAVRAAAPVAAPHTDEAADALVALRAAVPIAAARPDETSGTLAALRAAAPEAQGDNGPGLRGDQLGRATPDRTGEDAAAPEATGLDAALQHATALDESSKQTPDISDPFADLPNPVESAGLAAPAEQDPLAGLDDLFAYELPPTAEDPFAGLTELLGSDVPVAAGGPLARLNDLPAFEVPTPESAAEDPLADLAEFLAFDARPPEPAVAEPLGADLAAAEDPLAMLDALLNFDDVAEAGDPLDELDALLAFDAPTPAATPDDPLADLEALLAGPTPRADPLTAIDNPTAAPRTVQREPAMPVGAAFGRLTAPQPSAEALARPVFRMAILGDFSGRAARRELTTGAALAARRGIPFDVDNAEEVIEGFAMNLVLPIGAAGRGISVPLTDLDALHPDQLVENVALFDELKGLRQRLSTPSMAARAVAEMQGWGGAFREMAAPAASRSAATSVPADLRLSDFQRLIGDGVPRPATPSPAADLIAQIVGPHVVPGPNPQAEALRASVDEAMSAAMRLVLHHPEFQAIEAQWRAIDLLARRIETDARLQLVLYDISAAEFGADLASAADLSQSGMFRLLTAPMTEEGSCGFSAVFGLYTFEETPPHADLLGRMARIAQHVQAPFFAALSPAHIEVAKADRHPLVARAWEALGAESAAAWLGLATPRFLMRRPYGARSEPIDAFDFEEFTMAEGLSGMLWANPVILVAILLAQAWTDGKGKPVLGQAMSLGEMPYHFVTDGDGDQVPLPCTERNMTAAKVEQTVMRGLMPVVSIRGRDVVRLASFQSVAGGEILGRWSGNLPPPRPSAPQPALTAIHAPPSAAATLLDDDLDALLAGFGDAPAAPADPGAIDAELAALLEGL